METGLLPALNAQICIVEAAPAAPYTLSTVDCSLSLRPVRVLENQNPFRPEQRREVLLEPLDNESLAAIVTRAGFRPEDYECSLNGQPISIDNIWSTAVKPGHEIVLFPMAAGGGFGKQMMGLLIVLAGAVAGLLTAGAALAVFPALLGVLGAGGTSALFAISAALGSSLLSMALQPGLPRPPNYSASYDAAGPKGLAAPGTPVPKGYGKFGWCGNIVSSYVQFAGKDAFINVLPCYGWGPAVSINNPKINGKPVSNFFDLSYQNRMGANNQTPIDGFDRTTNGYPQEIDLLVSEGAVTVPGTGTNVTGIEVTVKFPNGLYRITNDGNYVPLKFIYAIAVAPHGTGSWQSPLFPSQSFLQTIGTTHMDGSVTWPAWNVVPTDRFAGSGLVYAYDNGSHTPGDVWTATETVDVIDPGGGITTTSATFTGVWQPVDANLGPVICTHWWQGYVVVENSLISAFYDTQVIYGLAPGQWDVQVTKIGYCQDNNTSVVYADSTDAKHICDGWLWNINEVFWSNLSYPNMILLGIHALATSQLSGADIQVMTEIVHDIGADTTLPAALAGFAHDNPAIVAYDVIMNPLYGAASSVPLLRVDVPAFVAWAEFNDELVENQDGTFVRRHIFNGVFDQAGDVWKTLQTIGNMSRAIVYPLGMQYTVVIDTPADPVQLFIAGNTYKDSFQELWVSLDDRATLVECDFADAARNYRMDLPVSVMTAADVNSGLQPKPARTRLIGCTSRDQAWRWTYYQLISTKLTLRTVQFTAAIEAVCCQRGSVIAIQSDVVQWATGGRIQQGSTLSALNIDRTDLTFAAASGWTVSVQHPVILRGTATISAIAGQVVSMAATLPAGRILKLVAPDGTEYVVTGSSGSAVTINAIAPASAVPLAAGQLVMLYDASVIEVRDVTGVTVTDPNQGAAVITVAENFSAVPTPDCAWAYGQSAGSQPAKLFRVVGIKKHGDFKFDIAATEYNAALYVDPVPNYGQIVGVPNAAPTISNLSLTEVYQNGLATGNTNSAVVAVAWRNGNTAVGAQVELLAGTAGVGPGAAASWQVLGKIQGAGCTFVGTVGVTYQVRVAGFDWQGNLLGSPALASITVVAATGAPANVAGFTGYAITGGAVLSWTAVTGADHYEIRLAASVAVADWDTATVLWDGTGTTWTDTTVRSSGVYMIVAVSSLATGSVESVTPNAWGVGGLAIANYSTVAALLAAGTANYVSGSTLTFAIPGGSAYDNSGAAVTVAAQTLTFTGPGVAGDSYYAYAYLDNSMTLKAFPDPGSNALPDSAPSNADAAAAVLAGIANMIVIWAVPSGGGSGTGSKILGQVRQYYGL